MHENLLYTLFFSCFLVISSFSVEPNYFDNQSELMKTLNALAAYCRETLENYNKKNFSKVLQDVARATQSGLPDSSVVSATLSKVAAEQAELYHSIGLSKKIAQELSIVKWDIFTKIANAYQTPEIDKLKKDLISEDYTGLETFVKSINSTHVEAANIESPEKVDYQLFSPFIANEAKQKYKKQAIIFFKGQIISEFYQRLNTHLPQNV